MNWMGSSAWFENMNSRARIFYATSIWRMQLKESNKIKHCCNTFIWRTLQMMRFKNLNSRGRTCLHHIHLKNATKKIKQNKTYVATQSFEEFSKNHIKQHTYERNRISHTACQWECTTNSDATHTLIYVILTAFVFRWLLSAAFNRISSNILHIASVGCAAHQRDTRACVVTHTAVTTANIRSERTRHCCMRTRRTK